MNKSLPKLKFDDQTLLLLLLNERGMSRAQYIKWATRKYELQQRTLLEHITTPAPTGLTPSGQPRWSNSTVWSTPNWLITTTRYGRIKDIQVRQRSVVRTPTIQYRRRRTMEPH